MMISDSAIAAKGRWIFFFQGFDIQSAGKLFKLGQKLFSGPGRHLLHMLDSFPEGNQQRRQIFFVK